ncbi:MAG: TIGR03960 family B12-binding radical SAM protein [Clostridium sp.]|nr:TIGR03960 family B12-binding radical SAM protein [Clostridium sp.]
MRTLALPEEVLLTIEKPARYIGGEINSVMKEKSRIDVRFCMCFPDVYEIGMSHLGIQILYDMFNQWEDVWCERVYSPWVDLDRIMRERGIPLFALESQEPITDFDFLGITLQYEMCYTNVLQVLDLSGIPFLAKERTWDHPIVIGGGPCTYNPEPIAPFFDLFYIGDGETMYRRLLDLYKEMRAQGADRTSFLREAGKLPGIYAPQFYTPHYHADGTLRDFTADDESMPRTITKELVTDVSNTYYPLKPVVPFIKCTQDRVVLEIQRGCIRGCRFCQAGQLYRPVRERSLSMLKEHAMKMIDYTGHEEISLSSLSSSDYSKLPELLSYLIEECEKRKVNISLPSLRIDAFSLDVMNKVQDIRKSSLTFAPEAGTQRLRNVINKGLTKEVILDGAIEAFKGGWTRVKLYFMLGLPTETEEDIRGIAELANEIAAAFFETVPKEKRREKIQIVVSTSFFIPKPFTPLQWASMYPKETYIEKAYATRKAISEQLNQRSIKYNWHEADVSVIEGVLARGDRRIADVVLNAYRRGCFFDAWSEYYHHEEWLAAFEECGLSIDFYTLRERSLNELFPWDFIDCGVTKDFLKREWSRAMAAEVTPNCKQKCSACGAARFGCGICIEPRGSMEPKGSMEPRGSMEPGGSMEPRGGGAA